MKEPLPLASFWRRLGAALIDFVVCLLAIYGIGWLCSTSRLTALLLIVPLGVSTLAYYVVMHAKLGQTLGKYICRVRVVRLSADPIGWRESLLRSSVDILFSFNWFLAVPPAVAALGAEAFVGQGWGGIYRLIQPTFPSHFEAIALVAGVWAWSEFAVMLTNRRRRAIHDFIAGTVVVRVSA